jgi:nickel/cobalt exporter
MNQIIIGSLILSVLHALIPSHWLPFVTIGKSEHWTESRTLTVTVLAGFAHTVSTTILGLIVGRAGYELSENYHELAESVIPAVLLMLGLWYLMQHLRHQHSHEHIDAQKQKGKSFTALLLSLCLGMFLSPCMEINAYFLSAGALGWQALGMVALIYNIITLAGMLLMVLVASRGLRLINAHWFEHNENLITGLTLIGLAILNFFIEF